MDALKELEFWNNNFYKPDLLENEFELDLIK
jgi:hypothetical protein